METIIFMLIGIVIGVIIGWLLSKWQNAGRIGAFYAKYNELDKRCAIAVADKERIEQQAAIDKKEMQERLAAAQEEHVRQIADNNKVLEQQMKMMEERLKNATTELLKLRSQELQETNSTQMSAIINPLKESIGEMKQAMDNTREQGTKNTASLEKAIENMINRAAEIGNKADNLANALKNENKMQGNWGEMILSELLESEGLKRGVHYSVQETLRDEHGNALRNDETGQKMIPDVILHFPDNRDAIIDSKTSLTAFIDYQNAESEEARNDALSRHVQSLRSHVRELANKNYKAYIKPPKQTLNYVIMFVPNETALQLALLNDAGLWREAYDKGVFITGEQNLLAVLRLIEVAWVQQEQTRNQEEILKQARLLLDRVGAFMEHFRDVAQKLDAAQESYQKAKDKLITGKQNILGPAKKLADMSGQENPKRRIGILEEE